MLTTGQQAPMFTDIPAFQKNAFKKISLSDYAGRWLMFFFYPRDFTFVCPTELRGFAQSEAQFKELGCDILAISTDSEWSHKAWFERDLPEVTYPILADNTHDISKAYGVYNEKEGMAERGLFIIDPNGVIQYALASTGSVGRSAKETLRVLKAMQSGNLCPMDWEEGDETLGKA